MAQRGREGGAQVEMSEGFTPAIATTLSAANGAASNSGGRRREDDMNLVARSGAGGIRRLTPLECERLQGFPDGWTAGATDSARYRMLGNAVCVPVAEWIGRRMLEMDRA